MEKIEKLLQEENWQEAKQSADDWIKQSSDPEQTLNSLGLMFAQHGKMREAIHYFEKAITLNPQHVYTHNNISNAYLALKQIEKAKQHLHQALSINPHHAESYNNLGRLLYKQNLFQEAIPYLEKAIRIYPDYWEAHYNLAHSLSKLNQMTRAAHHYEEVIRLMPEHPIAHLNLGLIYFEETKMTEAIPHLSKALEISPDLVTAAEYLGHAYIATGEVVPAIEAFEKALQLSPELSIAHHNLGVLYLRQQNNPKALAHFEEALRLDPQNDTAHHMVWSLKGIETEEAPLGYITELFDQYAEYYDEHLKEKLHYVVPGLLRQAVSRCMGNKIRAGRILDLGCGTGLCGVFFRDLAIELIGIDLSEKMIEKARILGAYDELIVTDFHQYLANESLPPFDLIVSGDVLVYSGDLDDTFKKVSQKLVPNGLFAFTTEHLPESLPTEQGNTKHGYHLNTTGRFAHSNAYIHQLAQKYQLEVALEERITPREHEGKAVQGDLYVIQKMNTDKI